MTNVEKSEISPHVKNFPNFSAQPKWKNLKFLHILDVYDVENVSTNVQFMLFCCKISFVAIYAVLSRNQFCYNLRTFVWRTFLPKIAYMWRKYDKYEVCVRYSTSLLFREIQDTEIEDEIREAFRVFDKEGHGFICAPGMNSSKKYWLR